MPGIPTPPSALAVTATRPAADAPVAPAPAAAADGPAADAPPAGPASGGAPRWLWPVLAGAAGLATLAPSLYGLGRQMWRQEHRQFFPFVLAGVAYLVWFKTRPAAAPPAARPRPAFAAGLWLAAALMAAAAVVSGPWMGGAALLALLPAWTYSLGGWPLVRHLSGVWLFLLLALPLPLGGDGALVRSLQRAASAAAGGVLDLLGYVHVPRGVTLSVAGYDRPFFVDQACSGVNSLFSALCCVGFYLVWVGRGLVRSGVILAGTVGWVLAANAARVLAIVLGTVELGGADWAAGGVDLSLNAGGWGHELLGFVAFGCVLGLVVSTDRLLAFLVPRAEVEVGNAAEAGGVADRFARPLRDRLRPAATPLWATAAAAFALLAAVWLVLPPRVTIDQGLAADLGELRPVPEDALPAEWNGWRRVRYEQKERDDDDLAGRFSRIWWYANGPRVAAISIDGPFWEWHDLAYCYRGQGWNCEDVTDVRYADAFDADPARRAEPRENGTQSVYSVGSVGSPGAPLEDASALPADRAGGPDAAGGYTEMELQNDAGEYGLVLFAGYDDAHAGIDPVLQRVDLDRRLLNLRRVWDRLSGGGDGGDAQVGRTYQVQLLSTGLIEPDDAAKDDLRALFHEMRRRLVARGAAGGGDDAANGGPATAAADGPAEAPAGGAARG